MQFNAIFVARKFDSSAVLCRILRCMNIIAVGLFHLYFLSRVDVNSLYRYIEVDFTFGLLGYVRHNEEFIMSKFCCIHFTVTVVFGRAQEYCS